MLPKKIYSTIVLCLLVGDLLSCGALFPGANGSLPMLRRDALHDQHADQISKNQGKKSSPQDSEEIQGLSLNSKLKMKTGTRLSRDLQQALDLSDRELCVELDEFSCLESVHKISLGGVDPYDKNIYLPREGSDAVTPLVVERVVLKACAERVRRDLRGGTPLIFGRGERELAVRSLYERAFLREATVEEIASVLAALREFQGDEWALASCFAVFSSIEFLFY